MGEACRVHVGGLSIGGRIILNWILKKSDAASWTVFFWLRIGASYGLL